MRRDSAQLQVRVSTNPCHPDGLTAIRATGEVRSDGCSTHAGAKDPLRRLTQHARDLAAERGCCLALPHGKGGVRQLKSALRRPPVLPLPAGPSPAPRRGRRHNCSHYNDVQVFGDLLDEARTCCLCAVSVYRVFCGCVRDSAAPSAPNPIIMAQFGTGIAWGSSVDEVWQRPRPPPAVPDVASGRAATASCPHPPGTDTRGHDKFLRVCTGQRWPLLQRD
ncbi:hypothetical protein GWK47_032684 [Chionoecetes opilio]|uniref:Uncharacterized protein n=1 Tax=Chionoecetes opilio TaxID=41210 RepID=A0A8J4YK67_CHIOP|nr:hypothetical protein GWK47_032684 [Chionoecetes opilio]